MVALVRQSCATSTGVTADPGRRDRHALGRRAAAVRRRARRARRAHPCRGRRRCRAWRCAVRATTASAFRPASPRPTQRPTASRGVWPRTIAAASTMADGDGRLARRRANSTTSSATPPGRCSGAATPLGAADRPALAAEVEALFEQLAAKDVVVRGTYDVSALRADADVHDLVARRRPPNSCRRPTAASAEPNSAPTCEPVWSQMALHRPAEFNKSHVPGVPRRGEPACLRLRVPVRSLLRVVPAARRRAPRAARRARADGPRVSGRAREHGRSFALGDYEWILAFEADELHRIVDLMRHLRGSETRRHVREEVPFYTGTRRELGELVASLP